jgi:heme/copper-type cytochrome/quinol oxidase subunit 1
VRIGLDRPYVMCWMIIPIVLILGFLAGDTGLDISLHDTYYVIGYRNLTLFCSLILAVSGLIYWLILRNSLRLERKLMSWHLGLLISGLIILMSIAAITGFMTSSDRISMEWSYSYTFILLIIGGIVSVMIGSILLVINLLIGLIKIKNE